VRSGVKFRPCWMDVFSLLHRAKVGPGRMYCSLKMFLCCSNHRDGFPCECLVPRRSCQAYVVVHQTLRSQSTSQNLTVVWDTHDRTARRSEPLSSATRTHLPHSAYVQHHGTQTRQLVDKPALVPSNQIAFTRHNSKTSRPPCPESASPNHSSIPTATTPQKWRLPALSRRLSSSGVRPVPHHA